MTPPPDAPFSEIAAALRARQTFVVMSHHRPDGDAYGCQLAMGLSLRELGKDVTFWNEDGLLEKFRFLPGADLVVAPAAGAPKRDFDALVALDCSTFPRLGKPLQNLGKVGLTVNLDHHVSNERYGDLVHVDPFAPATGQLLYELFVAEKLPFTKEMADCLFVAISTDTGSFQYSNTTARTFEITADLVRRGADVAALSQACYERQPLRRIGLLRDVFNDLDLSCDNRVATAAMTIKQSNALGLQPGDTEGVIDHLRAIDTVEVAGFFEESLTGSGQPVVRVSLRSKRDDCDVSAILARFGGGGHRLAAGARIPGSLAGVRQQVIQAIHDSLASLRRS
jgi:bifunctional oligoribonuclease and PAP phosphatase NrnA